MSQNKRPLNLAILIFVGYLTNAQAAPPPAPAPAPVQPWQVDTAACVASTTATLNSVSFRLEVAVDSAAKTRPVEIRVIPSAELSPAVAGIKYAQDKKTSYAFGPLAPNLVPGSPVQAFWNIPRGTANLISTLKRENKFPVSLLSAGAPPVALTFTLKGSTAALSQLQKACNAGKDLAADAFEKAFLPKVVATVDPTKLQAADTARLRDLIAAAFGAFQTSNTTQAQLNALSAKYLKQIAEYEKLSSNISKIQTGTVDKLNARKAASQANIDNANAEIPVLRASVAQQEALLTGANSELDAANADIAPFLPTLAKYRAAVGDAQSIADRASNALSDAQNYESQTRRRLQQIIDGISQQQSRISSIQSQISSLRPQLSNAQYEADRARRNYSDAQGVRQRFDRNYELSRRTSADSQLSSIMSDLRSAESQAQQASQRVSQAQSAQQQAASALQSCQAQTPAVDCSSQQNAANSAASALNSAQSDYSSAENRRSSLQRDADRRRSSICDDVDRQYNELLRCEQEAQRRYDQAQSCANDLQNKIQCLIAQDLPQAQNSLSQFENAKPGAENDVNNAIQGVASANRSLANAEAGVSRAQARLDDWKQTSGYNVKRAAVVAAQQKIDGIKASLASLDHKIAADQKLIVAETKNLVAIEKSMQAALALIAQKEARSAEVQKILAPYFAQRDPLAAAKAAADQTFKSSQAAFAAGLPQAAAQMLAEEFAL